MTTPKQKEYNTLYVTRERLLKRQDQDLVEDEGVLSLIKEAEKKLKKSITRKKISQSKRYKENNKKIICRQGFIKK